MAIGAIAGYQLFFFAGVARTGVAVGTVVAIGAAPVLAGLMGLLLLKERPTRRWLAATLLAVAGCTLLIVTGGDVRIDLPGIILAVGAGAAYALYTIASKELLRAQPPDAVTAVAFFGGALLLAPLLLFVDLGWLAQPQGVLVALHLGLVTTALAYMLYIRGLLTLPTATAVTLALAEPLTAALLGTLVLGERLSVPSLLGMALIFAGLIVLTTGAWRRRSAIAQTIKPTLHR
jgi:DME family drug/metabolite transporter